MPLTCIRFLVLLLGGAVTLSTQPGLELRTEWMMDGQGEPDSIPAFLKLLHPKLTAQFVLAHQV